jgi:hypothetical protein
VVDCFYLFYFSRTLLNFIFLKALACSKGLGFFGGGGGGASTTPPIF